jgi:hypothetical protein
MLRDTLVGVQIVGGLVLILAVARLTVWPVPEQGGSKTVSAVLSVWSLV